MTWSEWIESEFNTDNFVIAGNYIKKSDNHYIYNEDATAWVIKDDVIEYGEHYSAYLESVSPPGAPPLDI